MPANEGEEIQGSLSLLDLDAKSHSQYDCVSYVWGNSESTELALINKKHVPIKRNLHDCLRHIRSTTNMMTIWADALCINQLDMEEKSRQVAGMVQVYRQCSKVYIWLGLPDVSNLTGNPFELLNFFVSGKHWYELPGFERDKSSGLWIWKENKACDQLLNDFLQVVKSPWWTRAWTVQECLLPRNSLIMLGTWSVTWDHMSKAEILKDSHGDGPAQCCKEAINAFNPHQRVLIEEWMWHPGRGRTFMSVIRGTSPPLCFHQAIMAFTSRTCTDPRDKIYSMLALATHPIYRDFTVNYQENVSAVYTDIFTRMVRETNDDFTCFIGEGFGSSMDGLPSWVQDFSQIRPLNVVAVEERRIRYRALYRASLMLPIEPLWNERKEFHYRGTYADTVRAVGHPPYLTNAPLRDTFSQWLKLCKEVIGPCEPQVLRSTFSRIICSDVCKTLDGGAEFRRAKEADFPKKDIWDRLMEGDVYATDQRAFGWGLNFGFTGRCFFTTKSGKMGLCHPNTKLGDEVWVLRGVRVPFVLHPIEDAEQGCASRYSFLGDCFLQGIMDGELGEKEKSMERPVIFI